MKSSGSEKETKEKAEQKNVITTDDDLLTEEKQDMLGRLQAKLGKTKEETKKIISDYKNKKNNN